MIDLGHLGRRVRALPPIAILGIGAVAFLLYAYPGYITPESVEILAAARDGDTHTWWPVYTAAWSACEIVLAGPPGLLLAQTALFLAGAYHLAQRAGLAPRRAAIAAVALILFPPVTTVMSALWPDALLTATLLAGAAAIGGERHWLRGLGLASLAIAAGLRDGAELAVIPIVLVLLRKNARRLALAGAAGAATIVASLALTWSLGGGTTGRFTATTAAYDVAGILARTDLDDAPARDALAGVPLRDPTAAGATLRAEAHRAIMTRSWWGVTRGDAALFAPITRMDDLDAIGRAWRTLALAHPGAYLAQRGRILAGQLGVLRAPTFGPVPSDVAPGSADMRAALAVDASRSVVQDALLWIMHRLASTPLFWPLVYLVAAVVALVLAIRRRAPVALALAASGLAYELVVLVVAPQPEYRLSHWMVTSAMLALVTLVMRPGRNPRRAQPDPAVLA